MGMTIAYNYYGKYKIFETTNQEIYEVEKCQAIIFPGHMALFQQLESLLECWVAKHMVQTC